MRVVVLRMTDHYYSKNPQSKKTPVELTCELKGNEFHLLASAGVFSKSNIDFGTRTLIDAFKMPDTSGDVLDLGCGYGAIGLAVAKAHPDRFVMMADVNERAVELAKENAARNNVVNVDVYESDGFKQVPSEKFAAILTNPPIRAGKQVIYKWFEESAHYLAKDGELWIVVQKKQGAPSMKTFLSGVFREVVTVTHEKGYHIFRAKHVID